jgi:hypothetical protein
MWDFTEVHRGNQINTNIERKVKGKCFIFIFPEIGPGTAHFIHFK